MTQLMFTVAQEQATGKTFGFPRDAVTQTFAFVGKRGSGKTYGCGKFIEELIDKGIQVIIVDPVGNWWGVRIAGESGNGLTIPVLGGMHGDIPIHHLAGEAVGQYLAQYKLPAVLDVSQFTGGEQRKFVEAFARSFFESKKRNISPVMIIWEEAQVFVPQRVGPSEAPMVGAMEKLIKIGRNYGIGCTLIGQRPQSINKDVLNQTECFVCFQLTAPHERKAVADWMSHAGIGKADDEDTADFNQIPKLKKGEALLWSPSWLEVRTRVKFLPKRTSDFSKTPDIADLLVGNTITPIKIPQLALAELQKAMEAVLGQVAEKDTKVLQKQIKDLTRQLDQALTENRELRDREIHPAIQHVEVPVIRGDDLTLLKNFASVLQDSTGRIAVIGSQVGTALQAAVERAERIPARSGVSTLAKAAMLGTAVVIATPHAREVTPPAHTEPSANGHAPRRSRASKADGPEAPAKPKRSASGIRAMNPETQEWEMLASGEIKMLENLAARHPKGYMTNHLAVITGFALAGGFKNYVSHLKKLLLIERDGAYLTITEAGLKVLPQKPPLITAQQILEIWKAKLVGRSRDMLQLFFDARGTPLTLQHVAESVSMKVAGGFKNYVGDLKGNNLIDKGTGGYRIAEVFMAHA